MWSAFRNYPHQGHIYNIDESGATPPNAELREDSTFELREDGSFELRE